MSTNDWTPPSDDDTVRLLRTMPLPQHLGGGLCKHAAWRMDALRAEVLQYGNTMGRIAIALFGDQNNRTDEDCVRRAERIGLEHAQRGIDLEAALHALDHGLTLHADCAERAERAEAERDALRADAERYRWLRDKGNWRLYILQLPPRQMDAAIDAARTEGEGRWKL